MSLQEELEQIRLHALDFSDLFILLYLFIIYCSGLLLGFIYLSSVIFKKNKTIQNKFIGKLCCHYSCVTYSSSLRFVRSFFTQRKKFFQLNILRLIFQRSSSRLLIIVTVSEKGKLNAVSRQTKATSWFLSRRFFKKNFYANSVYRKTLITAGPQVSFAPS